MQLWGKFFNLCTVSGRALADFGSSLSLRCLARLGSALSHVPCSVLPCGRGSSQFLAATHLCRFACAFTFAFMFLVACLGSSLSVYCLVRLGASLSVLGLTRICNSCLIASAFGVLLARYCLHGRVVSSACWRSGIGNSCFCSGGSFTRLGSSLPLLGLTRLGSSIICCIAIISMFGLARIGSSLSNTYVFSINLIC